MNDTIENAIRESMNSTAIDYVLSSTVDSSGEIHRIQTSKGALVLSLSREGFIAEIETLDPKNIIIDAPESWSLGYPLKSKIQFYWRIFISYAEGKLGDRVYKSRN